jgi:hypothetical protein
MGFDESLAQYAKHAFWANCTFNWGVVTNGGLTIGGLAFADEPAVADQVAKVLAKAAAGIQCPFSSFAPHGAWHEGSMYWQYVAERAAAATDHYSHVRAATANHWGVQVRRRVRRGDDGVPARGLRAGRRRKGQRAVGRPDKRPRLQ